MDRQIAATLLTALLAACTPAAIGQDFRIESEVFLEEEKQPVAESLTLFVGAMAYDFVLTDPQEIAIFDLHREQVVLLDVGRQMRLTLSQHQILEILAALKTELAEKAPMFTDPQFESSFDPSSGWLTLASQHITYRARGSAPERKASLRAWRQFADWSARLNATVPGRMPPFPRLQLNEAISRREILPEEVEVTITPERRLLKAKPIQLRSRHVMIWQLSRSDRARIDKANLYRATFKPVGLKQYRQLDNRQE